MIRIAYEIIATNNKINNLQQVKYFNMLVYNTKQKEIMPKKLQKQLQRKNKHILTTKINSFCNYKIKVDQK